MLQVPCWQLQQRCRVWDLFPVPFRVLPGRQPVHILQALSHRQGLIPVHDTFFQSVNRNIQHQPMRHIRSTHVHDTFFPCLIWPCTGTYNTNPGGNSLASCTLCRQGTYSNETAQSSENTCKSCPAGTYNFYTGAQSQVLCLACPAGTFSNAGSSSCTACQSGSYSSQPGASSCVAASPGYRTVLNTAKWSPACVSLGQACLDTSPHTITLGSTSQVCQIPSKSNRLNTSDHVLWAGRVPCWILQYWWCHSVHGLPGREVLHHSPRHWNRHVPELPQGVVFVQRRVHPLHGLRRRLLRHPDRPDVLQQQLPGLCHGHLLWR